MAMQQLDASLRPTTSRELVEQERLDAHKAAMIVVSSRISHLTSAAADIRRRFC